MLKQLEDLKVEKDGLLERLQDSMALASYVKDEPEEEKSMTSEASSLPESDTTDTTSEPGKPEEASADVGGEVQQPDPELERLTEELEKYKNLFDSVQDEVKNMAEIAISNNAKTGISSYPSKIDLGPDERRAAPPAGSRQEPQGIPELCAETQVGGRGEHGDELLIKKGIEEEIRQFLGIYWNDVIDNAEKLYEIYSTGVDRTMKLFAISLTEKKEKVKEKYKIVPQVTPEGEGAPSDSGAQSA
ncbi:hypothetical protein CEXT_553401 [Caerostris extrusa]|uniref:Uncharacterized protein n=1 Tax=Caerostris extrusa TaxID=172846 RepID=A0AAV4XI26_CAEEX|nr:hypothetical protein CEXT_553401 [Caerostris extrusa]